MKILLLLMIYIQLCWNMKIFPNTNHHLNEFHQLENNSKIATLPFIFHTNQLPTNLKLMPTIGNGHISYTILSDSIYMNGLYNGKTGLSHRARIPNWSNLILTPINNNNSPSPVQESSATSSITQHSYSLNVRDGIFTILIENNQMRIEQLIFAHRFYNRIIVNQINIYRKINKGAIQVKVQLDSGPETSEDILFESLEYLLLNSTNISNHKYQFNPDEINTAILNIKKGITKQVENSDYQKSGTDICCVWNQIPELLQLNENETFKSYRYLLSIDNSCHIAQEEIQQAFKKTCKNFLDSHRDQWKYFWETIRIETIGNLELNRAIYGSLFYMANALPSIRSNQQNHPFYGISPTGLGRGGNNLDDYQGHNFWDTEIWMLPVITQMNPEWTKQLLNYRYQMLTIAKDNSKKLGYKGAKFPWESAFTGSETTNPCCPEVAQFQHHITADIAFGLKNYYSNTYDLEWFKNYGCPLAKSIAEFWASRVVLVPYNDQHHHYSDNNSKKYKYSIKNVMGPDEDHPNITDNVYTNVVAGYALQFAANICKNFVPISVSTEWLNIADNLNILYDNIEDYHPQFDGYKLNTIIKQADVILLGYPLMFPMNDSTRRNDLQIYEKVTRKSGPAMTWTMHAINHLDIDELDKANELFNQSYLNYIRAPFQVFTEVTTNNSGAVNFLTGAGGFLQAIINGYGGVRIYIDHMIIQRPHIPPNTTKFIISGIKYLGSTFEIIVYKDSISTIRCKSINRVNPLILHADYPNAKQFDVTKNFIYGIKSKRIVIRPKRIQQFKEWHF